MFMQYIIAMGISVIAIVIAVILGDYGPWYLSWVLGTGFMILVAVSAGVLFEAQEEAKAGGGNASAPAGDVVHIVAGSAKGDGAKRL
ncbi:hypothetical protein [Aquabacter cavernae]|uniref:hypothetical protein n=1 Tax=Aquabacter cavernae TaxID=2496029 RepID=UPI00196AB32A|nr:hypothetical protein [Aquabacter cavernae]